MRKHRGFLKAFLLLTTISAAVPSTCYGAEPAENFYGDATSLLGNNVIFRGSYLKHQVNSIAFQERVHQAESSWEVAGKELVQGPVPKRGFKGLQKLWQK